MLVLLYFIWLSLCIFTPACSPPLPHVKAQGLMGSKGSQQPGRLGLGLWRLLPFSFFPPPSQLLFVTDSDGCLPGCVASLSVFSCSDPLAGWLRKMCFRCPVILGIEGIIFPLSDVFSLFSRLLLLWLPVGYW